MKVSAFKHSVLIPILTISINILLANGQDPTGKDPVVTDSANGTSMTPVTADAINLMQAVLPDVANDKQVICDATRKGDEDIKIDISGLMDYDDMLRLIVWNSKYNLKSGEKIFYFLPEASWKRPILKKMTSMFLKACPEKFVPPSFIYAAQELFMIYQNSINGSLVHLEAWRPFMDSILDKCSQTTTELKIIYIGLHGYGLEVETAQGDKETIGLLPPEEAADRIVDLDLIIDTMWWMFSFTFGNCYWSATTPSIWASRFKRLFYTDFLKELRHRWVHAGVYTDFGVIFGDFNLDKILKNIRFCVTAAYTRSGIPDRQLVRSLSITPPNMGIAASLNKKTGNALA